MIPSAELQRKISVSSKHYKRKLFQVKENETPVRSPKLRLGTLWLGFLIAACEVNSHPAYSGTAAALPKRTTSLLMREDCVDEVDVFDYGR